jgi:lipid A ethanolaminephosphotransferase
MSHLRRLDFIKNNINYEYLPSIIQKAGVDVLYKENNFGGCKDTCSGVNTIKTNYANNPEFCANGECADGIMSNGLSEYIRERNGAIFIVLHQHGVHRK